MIKRSITPLIKAAVKHYPAISVTGPRQSGKTTLVKSIFPDYLYTNLEEPSVRLFASQDPKSFLDQSKKMVIDEVQRVPELFSYIQVLVDENPQRKFILTGSQNFLVSEKISQSLAGRIGIFRLFPLSLAELKAENKLANNVFWQQIRGFYPRLYDDPKFPLSWYEDYVETYLERDVRQTSLVKDLTQFRQFLGLCAGRTGQLLNASTFANEIGVSVPTINHWISILEAGYILFRLPAFHKNINKRLIKSPKLYFLDVGLTCSLLGISEIDQLKHHPLVGNIFETMIISEYVKQNQHRALRYQLSFFRDRVGNEVDLVIDKKNELELVEVKHGQTFNQNFVKGFEYFQQTVGPVAKKILVSRIKSAQKRQGFELIPWWQVKISD